MTIAMTHSILLTTLPTIAQSLVSPGWNSTFPNAKEYCVDGSAPGFFDNRRLAFVATVSVAQLIQVT